MLSFISWDALSERCLAKALRFLNKSTKATLARNRTAAAMPNPMITTFPIIPVSLGAVGSCTGAAVIGAELEGVEVGAAVGLKVWPRKVGERVLHTRFFTHKSALPPHFAGRGQAAV
jgi:hypothetical protein